MLDLIGGALSFVGALLTIFLIALLVILIVSPFESLQWWAGWVADDDDADDVSEAGATVAATANQADQYVVFLPGVGAMGTDVDPWEQRLVDRLHAGLSGGVILSGFFPFTPRADTLTGDRRSAWFWRWLARLRDQRPSLMARLIDWRNLTQVFVSMDPRYGPIFNKGVEDKIAAVLHEQGYVARSGAPITLIGYSGGAQISLGAALYLFYELSAPVTVISLGGVLGDDPALDRVEHVYHLYGTNDLEAKMAKMAVPQRWAMSKGSRWNQALAAGKITLTCLGEMVHTGPKGYLDPDTKAPDGRSYLDVTSAAMLGIIESRTRSSVAV